MSAPVTGPTPDFSIRRTLGSSVWNCTRNRFKARMMSVTSSLMPAIEENSCLTPWILTDVTAVPSMEDSNTRRMPLPTVTP
jgi:hypothetical protein